jgi:hypothetical protein
MDRHENARLTPKESRWSARLRRTGEGQDGARIDDTRHGTLSLFAAVDTFPCICTYHPTANPRATALRDCRE